MADMEMGDAMMEAEVDPWAPQTSANTTSYSETRSTRERQQRDQFNVWSFIIKMYLKFCIFYGALIMLLKWSAQSGIEHNNHYTKVHYEYNYLVLWTYLRYILTIVCCMIIRNNPPKIGFKCFDFLFLLFIMVIRVSFIVYVIFIIYPDFFKIFSETWYLGEKTKSQSDNEPFIANESILNCVVCWFISLIFTLAIYIMILYAILIPIACIAACIKSRRSGRSNPFRMCCSVFCGTILPMYWNLLYSYVTGTSYRHPFIQDFNSTMTEEEARKQDEARKDFLKRKGGRFSGLLFDEKRDCPICLSTFEADDKVIQLQCSNKHIYHTDCLESMLKSGHVNRCCLCREQINYQHEA